MPQVAGLAAAASHVCFAVLGLSPWLLTSGIFSQGPRLVTACPEGPLIFAKISLAVTSAHSLPFLFVLGNDCRRSLRRRGRTAPATVTLRRSGAFCAALCLQLVACAAAVLLITSWDAQIGGRSWPLLAAAAMSGAVGACSMVVLWPFAALYRHTHVTALSLGVATAGVLSQALAGLQRVQDAG